MTKTVLITGASRGLGTALSQGFGNAGYKVFAGMREVAADFKGDSNIIPLKLDVTNPTHIIKAVHKVEQAGYGLTALVNNAGIYSGGPADSVEDADVRRTFDVNFFGALAVTRAFLPLFQQQKAGRVIMISSLSGLVSLPGDGIYAASKHALEAIAESLFFELVPWNIGVQLAEPGAFQSGLTGQQTDADANAHPTTDKSAHQKPPLPSAKETAEEIIQLIEQPAHLLRNPIGDQARSVFLQLGLSEQSGRQQFIRRVSGAEK